MTTVEFTASSTWLCPTGVTALDSVVCIGKGGDGGAYTSGKTGGGGGGYSQTSSVAVTAGVTYTITVDSTKSAFGADVVRANAGPNGANDQSVTSGASTTSAVGTVKYGGGQSGYVWTSEGGGGGGAGGPSGAGGSGNGRAGGAGNGTDAGTGGIGGWLQYGGVPPAGNGTSYGGGGGGGATDKASGTGGAGLVRISYTQAVSLTADVASIEVQGQAAGLTVSAKLTANVAALVVRPIGVNLEQPTTVYRVQLLWSASSIVDVTDRVLQAGWERSLSNYRRGLEIGIADITLENDDRSLSPLNLTNGVFRPGAGLTIEAAPTEGDVYKTIFTGYVDSIKVAPALSSPRNVTLSCRDRMRDMASRRIDTTVMTEVNVGSLMAVVLDGAAISVRSIDLIGDSIPFAWFRDRQVMGVVADVIDAGGYSAYVSGDGTFRFRDRFFDLGVTVAASYHEYSALTWELNDADVVNSILVRGEPRTIVDQLQDVAELSEVISIPAGESRGFFLEYQDPRNQENAPAVGVVTPVASIDWMLNAQADNSGTVLTGSGSITFAAFAETCVATLTNGSASTAYLTMFKVRGMPIQREPYVSIQGNDTASQSLYGIRDDTLETRLLGTQDRLTGRAADILDLYAEPVPRVSMTLVNRWPDVVDLDLADIVHLSESHLGLSDQFTISRVSHQIDAESRGWVHSVTYELDISKAVDRFTLSSSTLGVLDQNRLGRTADMTNITFPDSAAFPDVIKLVKLRGDFDEYAIYTPANANGIDWQRWFFSNRAVATPLVPCQFQRGTLAKLYYTTVIATTSANYSTGAQRTADTAQSPTAAFTGTWTAEGTYLGVPNIRYSTTVGDYAEYTITGSGALLIRGACVSNGGICVVTISPAIDESSWAIVKTDGERRINFATGSYGYAVHPVAIIPAHGTYTVRVTISSANPGTGRVYLGRFASFVLETAPVPPGMLGVWGTNTDVFAGARQSYNSGARMSFLFQDCTKIQIKIGKTTVCGIVGYTIVDTNGNVVISGEIDCYGSGVSSTETLVDDLIYGDYTLDLYSKNIKNPSSTGYRTYVYEAYAIDTSLPGDIETTTIDDQNANVWPGYSNDIVTFVSGNIELALNARKTGSASGQTFIGGSAHGHHRKVGELAFEVDGGVIDYASAPTGTEWFGTSIEVIANGELSYPEIAPEEWFADTSYVFLFDKNGYQADVTWSLKTGKSVDIFTDYTLMFGSFSRKEDENYGYGGGMHDVFFDDDRPMSYPQQSEESHDIGYKPTELHLFNSKMILRATVLNKDEIEEKYDDEYGGLLSFVRTLSTPYIKIYINGVLTSDGVPVTYPFSVTTKRRLTVATWDNT